MIKLISREWPREQFRVMKINLLGSFLGTKTTDLKIKPAKKQIDIDDTEVAVDAIVTFNF